MKDTLQEMPMGTMTLDQLQERFRYFGRRASQLCGTSADGKPLSASVKEFFDGLLASTTPEGIAARNEFMAKCEKDPVARQQFCALRLESYNNYILAQLNWISQYANVINLKDDERPIEHNTTDSEITCYYVARNGRPKMVKITKDDAEAFLPLRIVTTPKVRLQEWDIYRGSIVDAALATIRLSFDLTNKIEYEFFLNIRTNGFVATFDTSAAKKASRDYNPTSYIQTANLPTGNDITVTGATSSTKFGFATLDEIIDYAQRWAGTSPDGDLQPTGVIRLPSKHVKEFANGITPSGATNNAVAEALLEKGWTGTMYRGLNWVFKGDNTLDPAVATCYPEFNKKPARVWFKPSGDKEVVRTGNDDYELSQNNEQERWMKKVYGSSINTATRKLMARFTYRT